MSALQESSGYTDTSVYKVQCITYQIAKECAGIYFNVSFLGDWDKPPYCLRTVKEYRTPAIQAFRDIVAQKAWEIRRFNNA